jgi:L-asparaginase II
VPELVPLAEVVRSGFVESVHLGSAVALAPDGTVAVARGSVDAPVLPRSSAKPFQALACLLSGADLRGPGLAIAAGSHTGQDFHVRLVADMLAGAGLGFEALGCPADWPEDEATRHMLIRAGLTASRERMNCSGKHAAMLATCALRGWDIASYRDPTHPLQAAIAATFAELTGEPVAAVGVDGCGAPLFATSLYALARAFWQLQTAADGTAEARVAAAIRTYPEHVSGTTRDEARLLRALPGSIGKAGAEACYAVALPDGTAVALKIDDGGARARPVVMAAALRALGVDSPVLDAMANPAVLGGGRRVGAVRPTLPPR